MDYTQAYTSHPEHPQAHIKKLAAEASQLKTCVGTRIRQYVKHCTTTIHKDKTYFQHIYAFLMHFPSISHKTSMLYIDKIGN